MHGDFSRLSFHKRKHYSRVLQQQGRVCLDADTNENTAILVHYLRRLATDIIGLHGGPKDEAGFFIKVQEKNGKLFDLEIGPGHYYVQGLLVENEASDPPVTVTYYNQLDAYRDKERAEDRLPDGFPFLVLLKVWERHITAIEDPDIREKALGMNGPDTATRAKIVWQVLTMTSSPDLEVPELPPDKGGVDDAWPTWLTLLEPEDRGMIRARASREASADDDPCIVSPEARYRGAENQLYRVEIHTGGAAGTATFKWSRDNGAVTFPIESLKGNEVIVKSLGRDSRLTLAVGDWVEIVDDEYVLRGQPVPALLLRKVKAIEPLDRRVLLEDLPPGGTSSSVGQNSDRHPFLRRWDQQKKPARSGGLASNLGPDNAVITAADAKGWLDLEDGVQIQFKDGTYRSGDYWLIPARTAVGDVEWPTANGERVWCPPHGVDYYFAPLALVNALNDVVDLRGLFDHIPHLS